MRVPWRDRLWDQFICDDPLGNSSCTLLAAVGKGRDDSFEVASAGAPIDMLDQGASCSQRARDVHVAAGLHSGQAASVRDNPALRGTLHDTAVTLPGHAFEAVPFRWLNRESLAQGIGHDRVPLFNQNAQDAANAALNYDPPWVIDGGDQRAIVDAFFDRFPADSLIFVYLKHSPLQEQRTDRLWSAPRGSPGSRRRRCGHSPGTRRSAPLCGSGSSSTPAPGHDRRDPAAVSAALSLMDDGVEVGKALAWAPEGVDVEFSYVTEHLSDDAAIESLSALQFAAEGMREPRGRSPRCRPSVAAEPRSSGFGSCAAPPRACRAS